MNVWKAFAAPVCAGWHAMVRFPADAAARPVLGSGGAPEVYPTREAALQASVEALTGYLNGNYRRDGATLSDRDPDIDRVFANFTKQRGRERRIPVEVRR